MPMPMSISISGAMAKTKSKDANGVETLLQHTAIWRWDESSSGLPATVSTGFAALNAALPGGGWPAHSVIELVVEQEGIGELELLLPTLLRLIGEDRWLAWIQPPYLPHAPALVSRGLALPRILVIHGAQASECLWAVEQALRCGVCGAVLYWPQNARVLSDKALRRLQLAADAGNTLCFVFRRRWKEQGNSPAPLRLGLAAKSGGLQVQILKCRGVRPGTPITIPRPTRVEPW